MNHIDILKRSWKILWSYKTLWIFGVILALTGGSMARNGGNGQATFSGDQADYQLPLPHEVQSELDTLNEALDFAFAPVNLGAWIGVAVALMCFIFLLIVLFAIARYVSLVALIRMVDGYESSGEKVTWRQGFRLGWSRAAWRLFLIELLVLLAVFLAIILLFACAALPLLLGLAVSDGTPVLGIVGTIGLAFLVIFLMIVVGIALSLFLEMVRRLCVLQDLGVVESLRQGWLFLRQNFRDVFVMWLLVLGIRIALFIAMIPLVLLLVGFGLLVGGGIGVALYFAIAAFGSTIAGIITAVVVGILVLISVIAIPMTFLAGLMETYFSTTWTLTYRQLSLLELLGGPPSGTLEPGDLSPPADEDLTTGGPQASEEPPSAEGTDSAVIS